jgi:hypothetical protein
VEEVVLPSVMICTPCKDGKVDVNYALALTASCQVLTSAGIKYQTCNVSTSSIDNARSILATFFLRSPCTHLLFIDDDMAWASDLPLRLLNENVDIVGVPYRKKKEQPDFTIHRDQRVASLEDRPWMVLCNALGMGMTLIHRRVFEVLKESTPEYHAGEACAADPQYLFFRHDLVLDKDGKWKYESEDFHFCRSARNKGFEIWAYVDEDVPHIGRKAYCGTYSDHIGKGIDHGFTSERERHYPTLIGVEK